MGMVRKLTGRMRSGEGGRGFFGRIRRRIDEERARQETERQDPGPARGGRTRRPADEPLMMGGKRKRSLMKQRLGS